MSKTFVSRVYFPKDCSNAKSGWLIGWNICNFISCVATVVEEEERSMSSERLRGLIRDLSADPSLREVWTYCSSPPTILGRWNSDVSTTTNTNHHQFDSMFWLEMYPEFSRPALRAVFCVGSRYQTTSKIILYDRTQDSEYFSGKESTLQRGYQGSRRKLTVFEYTLRQCNAARWVADTISYRSLFQGRKNGNHDSYKMSMLSRIGFLLILCYRLLLGAVRSLLSYPILSSSGLCLMQISILCKQLHFRSTSIVYILSQTLCQSSLDSKNFSSQETSSKRVVEKVASFENGTTSGDGFDSSNIDDDDVVNSTTVLLSSNVENNSNMNTMKKMPMWQDPEAAARERINFNGEIFRIILDITLGIVAGFYLFSNSSSTDIPLTYLRLAMSTLNTIMDSNIEWLMGVPVGMKLNQPLTRQLGRLVLSVLRVWAHVMELVVKSYVLYFFFFQPPTNAVCFSTSIHFFFQN